MSYISKQNDAKIALINAIALSQHALARILSSIADVSAHSEITARNLQENIRLLTEYQSSMSQMITKIPLQRNKYGTPSLPWINTSQIPPLNNLCSVREKIE
ncbi:hypothetical protein [Paenibacillus crassostreae]|uniref:Uncharacterized protein n=1 Tax=Paenibacillus crassostreae TaxID=1763538 RepID=A0A162N8X1_9BACL|nr:hypothetical protein [Paenibacillus crassostreae]AOZ91964.1 hypothetical protein LPB68_06850 [Paenibacillus crassostreae]OAB77552.1 hypothetical protein PNBC_01600 [Paenibacillus crassostreae]